MPTSWQSPWIDVNARSDYCAMACKSQSECCAPGSGFCVWFVSRDPMPAVLCLRGYVWFIAPSVPFLDCGERPVTVSLALLCSVPASIFVPAAPKMQLQSFSNTSGWLRSSPPVRLNTARQQSRRYLAAKVNIHTRLTRALHVPTCGMRPLTCLASLQSRPRLVWVGETLLHCHAALAVAAACWGHSWGRVCAERPGCFEHCGPHCITVGAGLAWQTK